MAKLNVYFETYGCTSNQADTEIMKYIVGSSHRIVSRFHDCDVAVINSCGVIEHTQRKVFRQVSHYRSAGKKVVLTGCLPKIDPDSLLANGQNIAISPDSINLINQAIKCAVKDFPFNPLPQNLDKAGLRNPDGGVVFPIPIAEGCLGECSYCASPVRYSNRMQGTQAHSTGHRRFWKGFGKQSCRARRRNLPNRRRIQG
jgi:tRNA A37 methylthiotransferase MiaB